MLSRQTPDALILRVIPALRSTGFVVHIIQTEAFKSVQYGTEFGCYSIDTIYFIISFIPFLPLGDSLFYNMEPDGLQAVNMFLFEVIVKHGGLYF